MAKTDPLFDHYLHLKTFTNEVLRDLGRNEAAPREYRKFAVELLLTRKSPFAMHEDLQVFVGELRAELDGIQFDFPAPEPSPVPQIKASVTTSTLFGDGQQIDNRDKPEERFTGFDDVSISEPKTVPTEPAAPRRAKNPKDKPDAT